MASRDQMLSSCCLLVVEEVEDSVPQGEVEEGIRGADVGAGMTETATGFPVKGVAVVGILVDLSQLTHLLNPSDHVHCQALLRQAQEAMGALGAVIGHDLL